MNEFIDDTVLLLHLGFKGDDHGACDPCGHAAWGVEVDGDEVLQVVRDPYQSAVVDGVGDVSELKALVVGLADFKVFENHFFWLADEGPTLGRS